DQLARERVALVLPILDPVLQVGEVDREGLEQLREQARDLDGVRGRAAVEGEELALLRCQAETGHRRRLLSRSARGFPSGPVGNLTQVTLEVPDFRVYAGDERPQFANEAELECAKILD